MEDNLFGKKAHKEDHHFGKKPEEAPQIISPGSAHTHKEEASATAPAKTVVSEGSAASSPEASADTGDFTPPAALQRYIRKLDDPAALPTVESIVDHGDPRYRERIENFVELISREIHNKVDAKVFSPADPVAAHNTLIECINAVLEYKNYDLNSHEIADITRIIESDTFGLGPLDELLADDNISDIMVDGPNEVFIETKGQIDRTNIRFRSEEHLLNVCQRIVTRVGRHVDKASPICDARLPDGSRVNIILPPLSLKGPALTIRKFKKERLTLEKLVDFGTVDKRTAALLEIMMACRVNLLVTGGTGSGKTTFLNCLTKYISPRERIITCEDAAELQLQQAQVVSLETRPMSIEHEGQVTIRDLVRNCLRMRPDRIIVGEVRGPEAFDLLQAMNTGHDGSMGTFHANSPRDAIFRLENMVAMADLNIPISAIRDQIASSLEIIIHTQRLRDGSRKVMNITEICGEEDGVVVLQDIVSYEITGEMEAGKLAGEFKFSHIVPRFRAKARQYNLEMELMEIVQAGKG